MISTTLKWRIKDDLREVVSRSPDKVYITGIYIIPSDRAGEKYDGYVSDIPYRGVVQVIHQRIKYYFQKEMDGTFSVK